MKLSRRRWLGGAGALVGLPLLEAAVPHAQAADDVEPKRLLTYYVPNGMPMGAWTPAQTGPAFELSPLLAPLAAVRDEIVVVSGLRNAPADIDTAGHHASGTAGFLTAAQARRSESSPQLGPSVDQVFAEQHSGGTLIDSLALGLSGGDGFGNCDNGFSCAYSRSISWVDGVTPRSKIISARLAFDLMFHGQDPAATASQRARTRARRGSVLDYVGAQAQTLRGELTVADKVKVDEYLQAVREVERRIELSVDAACTTDDLEQALLQEPVDRVEHLELMHELMVLAFRCDATRAITFMLGNSASNRAFPWLGIGQGHHDLSHHAGDPAKQQALEQVSRWEMEQFGHLLQRLRDTPALDGSLLDHCLVLFGSELADGNAHTHDPLPVVLAGRAGGAMTPGHHLDASGHAWGELLVSVLHALDVPVERFGDDGEGPLPGLM